MHPHGYGREHLLGQTVQASAAEGRKTGQQNHSCSDDPFLHEAEEWHQLVQNAQRALMDLAEEERIQLEEKMRKNVQRSRELTFAEFLAIAADARAAAGVENPRQPAYFVEVTHCGENIMEAARALAENKGYNLLTAVQLLEDMPYVTQCSSKKEADMLVLQLAAAGAKARVKIKK